MKTIIFLVLLIPMIAFGAQVREAEGTDTPVGGAIELGRSFPSPYECLSWRGGKQGQIIELYVTNCSGRVDGWIYPQATQGGSAYIFLWNNETLVIKREPTTNQYSNQIRLYRRTP